MIKNQLYPYIEKYISEYLHGFTQEQLRVGVVSGIIQLDNIMLRCDKLNDKLDELDVPIWIKAGLISKIKITCSLMNFIGEKPLDILIEDIECVLTNSSKHIVQNKNTFIEENMFHMQEAYDPLDNNCQDIFKKKVNIYDSSIIHTKNDINSKSKVINDESKIGKIANGIYSKCLKFFYQKPFMVNFKINRITLRFEDDSLNYYGNFYFGLRIKNLEGSLSADGLIKKNTFKIEGMDIFYEPNCKKILIPGNVFLSYFNFNNNKYEISEKYYEYLKKLNISEMSNKSTNLIENFNCMGNIGITSLETGNIDFFAKNKNKNFKFSFQLATSEININIYPSLLKHLASLIETMRGYYLVKPIQDFKPMRKPYNSQDSNVINLSSKKEFLFKRKMIARDWLYYIVWFKRFKKAIYGNTYVSALNEEFYRYYNICCNTNNNEQSKIITINI